MAKGKLIYASDARKAILKAEPRAAYCIDNIPGVDAEEVVRCKDCEYYMEQLSIKRNACWVHPLSPHPMLEDEFCSRGKRRKSK